MKTPSTLIVMDGYGLSDAVAGNAVKAAATPNLTRLFTECCHCRLSASGSDVGLPPGQIGNSEVGHTNIGAGRVVFQDLPRISLAIEDGSFFENRAFLNAMRACRENGTSLHLMGLLSDGGVHSHINHLWAFLRMAKREGLSRVYIHGFLDGRDVSPTSGAGFTADCVRACQELGIGKLSTVMGRYYAMDRDNRWERVEKAYRAIVCGEGGIAPDPEAAVRASYAAGVTDEFVEPIICSAEGTLSSGDSVIFTNFRPDRARELTRALVDPDFSCFPRSRGFFPLHYVCLTEYDSAMPNVQVAFAHQPLYNIFGEYISRLGLKQLRIAETEKYAHVTFFFNGGREQPFEGEDRILIPSPHVATYDLKPEMSAFQVADAAVRCISSGEYDVIILNFANCDMVGHTGIFSAACRAVEAVDECVGRVVSATAEMGGISMITADHGNAECMLAEDGVSPMTAHTGNPVPFIIHGIKASLRDGRLSDIAPTLLDVLGLKKPSEMDGETLIITSHAEKPD